MQTETPVQPASPQPLTFGWRERIAVLVLLAITVVAYRQISSVPLLFDDHASIAENPTIRKITDLGAILHPPRAAGETVGGRPALNLSFAANYATSATSVGSYHAVNLLIHLAAGLLLFGLVRRTAVASIRAWSAPSVATTAAAVIAAIWLVHPLQTEAVTYIVQRAESLAAFFILLTLYGFVRALTSARPNRWLVLSVTAAWLGAGTKETAAAAPLIVLLYDRTLISGSFVAAWRRRRTYYTLLAGCWALIAFLIVQGNADRGGTAGFSTGVSPWIYALTQCGALSHYLRLAVIPSSLVFDHGLTFTRNIGDALAPGVLILALLAGAVTATAARRTAGYLGAVFFILLAPSSSFFPIASQPIAEHRMYLPLAAVITLACLGIHAAIGRRALPAGITAIALFAVVTYQRNHVYQSELSLWRDTVAHAPNNARAHNNLANALLALDRLDQAIAAYREALRLSPDYTDAHANLARALSRANRPADAISHYEAALAVRPGAADLRFNLGNARLHAGDLAGAQREFEAVIAAQPRHVDAHINLAATLLRRGREPEAISRYEAALRLAPDDAGAHIDLANLLLRHSRVSEAVRHYQEALRVRPDLTQVREQLARLQATPSVTPP